jgi:hypothetical protein
MQEELQEKRRQLEAYQRETRLQIIRQKADQTRDQLRQLDDLLATLDADANHPADQTNEDQQPAEDQQPLQHHQPPPRNRFNEVYPNPDHHNQHPPQRNYAQQAAYDPKSPLTHFLQTRGWPLEYKPQNLPRYDGSSDPRQFAMSYEAAVSAAGGDDYTMAKSFVIIARDVAQTWYANLQPGTIDSWAILREKLCNHFKGVSLATSNPIELFNCTQQEREPLKEFWRRFVQLRAKTPDITDDSVIIAATNGVRPGPCASRLARKPPRDTAELHEVMDKYIRSDTVHHSKIEALRPHSRPSPVNQQRTRYPRSEPYAVNTIETAPPQQQRHQQRTQQPPPEGRHEARSTNQNRPFQRNQSKIYCHFCGPDKGHTTKQCTYFAKGKEFQDT